MPALEVAVDWWTDADVSDRVRRKLNRLMRKLAPVLNEYEASLYDMTNLASNGYEYLSPKVELHVPLYEERVSFRLRMVRHDTTQIFVETECGETVAEVYLQ